MDVPLYSLALFCGIATVRATTIMDNARVRDRSAVFSLISGLALLAWFALLGLGFLIYDWWIPVVAGFATAFAAAFLVLRATHGFFYRIAPVMGLLAIAVCVYGWLKWSGG
jgi:predicted PurR-regulated permease PerM